MNIRDDIICDLLREVRTELGEQSVPKDVSERIEQRMRYRWGGQPIYIKVKDSDGRSMAVRSEYNGRNRQELQQKYGISRAQFYKIIKGG